VESSDTRPGVSVFDYQRPALLFGVSLIHLTALDGVSIPER
jgi:hypothetical protein